MMGIGISRREFARRERCSEGAVRKALDAGRLKALPDGSLDPAQLGSRWRTGYRVPANRAVAQSSIQVVRKVRVSRGKIDFSDLYTNIDKLTERLYSAMDDLDIDFVQTQVALYYLLLFNISLLDASLTNADFIEVTPDGWEVSMRRAIEVASRERNIGPVAALLRNQLEEAYGVLEERSLR
jgi:hypothetical protein